MDQTTITALVSILGPALWKVFETLLKKGADMAFDKGLEPLKDLIANGYDERKDAKALRRTILAALDEVTDSQAVDRYDKLLATLKLTGLDENTRLALAGAAVEKGIFYPTSISPV